MLVFFKQNLAFLSVPKTGTTAYELALRPAADIAFTKATKHMTVGKFHKRFAPFLDQTYGLKPERMAVMRDPIDVIRSWYKYRSPERMGDNKHCHGGVSFDEYVLDVISDKPSKPAGVGSQHSFLTLAGKGLPVHHLFAYERQRLLRDFLEQRFEREIEPKQKNVSPEIPAPLSPEVEAKLRAARPEDFALYDRILQADGVLRAYSEE
ncbi:hypothetical protein [Shimia aestuarii]|uniref:Sulfotransferase family protein n=1 Tax=Shimia aestuarii TaxID=254406 RepID=A0A1I4HCY4_9RHOB|nr:hypothetical protein [Shimia aestuarii]SFL39296.1 hypothetical protein SAMN04488042_10121 [Shimia aestuarii]